jgi:Tol biopolymer transport system component
VALGALYFTPGLWLSASRVEPELIQLTREHGLTMQPSLSSDGKLIAYSSDRAGGFADIYVQPVRGGQAGRLTFGQANHTQPQISPDLSRIVFHSDGETSGIYSVPILGGTETLLVKDGIGPRFSPDGLRIAYWAALREPGTSQAFGTAVFVLDLRIGEQRRVGHNLRIARHPVWSPNGMELLLWGSQDGIDFDWWIVGQDGGRAKATGAISSMRSAGLRPPLWGIPVLAPAQWLSGGGILFAGRKGDTTGIWEMQLNGAKSAGKLKRATSNAGEDVYPASSVDGRLVWTSLSTVCDIWSIPIRAEEGITNGPRVRLTDDDVWEIVPRISSNGRTLVFGRWRSGAREIWSKDLNTGSETPFVPAPTTGSYGGSPVANPEIERAAFIVDEGGRSILRVVGRAARSDMPICKGCRLLAWSKDGKRLAYAADSGASELATIDLNSGVRKSIASGSAIRFISAGLSPDDDWIAFEALSSDGPGLWIVRASGQEAVPMHDWISVAGAGNSPRKPRWSPNGSLVYFVSRADGHQCIWARRFDGAKGQMVGSSFPVHHFHSLRDSLDNLTASDFDFSLGSDKLVLNMVEVTGKIWMRAAEQIRP